jgi:predicted Zn-dependent protease
VRTLAVREPKTFTDPQIFFGSTVSSAAPIAQGDLLRTAAQTIRDAGLVGAGTVEANSDFRLVMNTAGFKGHTRFTYGEYTVTARTPSGSAAGWAWAGGNDALTMKPPAVTAKAIDLCKQGDKAVAVEPGRYTTILEPEAVAQLMAPATNKETFFLYGMSADYGMSVYSKKEGGNKLGMQMADRRVQLFFDPQDKDIAFSPLGRSGMLYERTPWHEKGVLKNLQDDEWYAKQFNRKALEDPLDHRAKLEIEGPTQTLEEMIASTRRGIWVHHFAGVTQVNNRSLLLSAMTHGGTFLIENGKVTRPIKNMWIRESPFFFLNRLEAFGPTQRSSRIFATPRLKVLDFDFTSLSDAV